MLLNARLCVTRIPHVARSFEICCVSSVTDFTQTIHISKTKIHQVVARQMKTKHGLQTSHILAAMDRRFWFHPSFVTCWFWGMFHSTRRLTLSNVRLCVARIPLLARTFVCLNETPWYIRYLMSTCSTWCRFSLYWVHRHLKSLTGYRY